MKEIPISDNHRRAISSTLGILDEMLCRIELLARGGVASGVLYQEHATLSWAQGEVVLREVATARVVLAELRDKLRLRVRSRNSAATIQVQSSCFQDSLLDLKAKRLRRYGEVGADFAEYFDPKVEELIGYLSRISKAAFGRVAGQESSPESEGLVKLPGIDGDGPQEE